MLRGSCPCVKQHPDTGIPTSQTANTFLLGSYVLGTRFIPYLCSDTMYDHIAREYQYQCPHLFTSPYHHHHSKPAASIQRLSQRPQRRPTTWPAFHLYRQGSGLRKRRKSAATDAITTTAAREKQPRQKRREASGRIGEIKSNLKPMHAPLTQFACSEKGYM